MRKSGDEVCGEASLNGQNTKPEEICILGWMLTKGWPQQRRILIITWIEILIQWLPVSFSQIALSSPNKLMNKGALVAQMEGMWGLSSMDSPRPAWPQLPPSAHLPALSPGYGAIRQGDQPAVWSAAGWLHWTFSVMEGAAFCTYWNRHLLWMQICLACVQCFW